MSKRHAFHTTEQPPLCGQKDRTGKRFLPTSQTTTAPEQITCEKCWTAVSLRPTKNQGMTEIAQAIEESQ